MKILENLQAILSTGYLSMILLGITFTGTRYSQFRINIFSYSEALDFLIAPFKDIQIVIYSLVPILITYIFLQFDKALKTKYPKVYSIIYLGTDKKSWFKKAWIFQWTIFLVIYTLLASSIYAGNFKKNFANTAQNVVIEFEGKQFVNGRMIGSNPNFIFIQDTSNANLIIPINSTVKLVKIPGLQNSK